MTNNTIGKWEGEYGDPGPCYRCNMWPCKNRYNCKDGPLMEKPQEPKEYTAKEIYLHLSCHRLERKRLFLALYLS